MVFQRSCNARLKTGMDYQHQQMLIIKQTSMTQLIFHHYLETSFRSLTVINKIYVFQEETPDLWFSTLRLIKIFCFASPFLKKKCYPFIGKSKFWVKSKKIFLWSDAVKTFQLKADFSQFWCEEKKTKTLCLNITE